MAASVADAPLPWGYLFGRELCTQHSIQDHLTCPPALRRLLPVKFRPYDVKLNPNNSASAADAARMILGNKGETVEETMAKLASPIVRVCKQRAL